MREVSDRHREILEAALDLMAERGYAGASLRELGLDGAAQAIE